MNPAWSLVLLLPTACATAGSTWMREPLAQPGVAAEDSDGALASLPEPVNRNPRQSLARDPRTSASHSDVAASDAENAAEPRPLLSATGKPTSPRRANPTSGHKGRILGQFRNTYYDFPSESGFAGGKVLLHDAQCKPITETSRTFFEALCVQGSGLLASGNAISFNRRDCPCAELCPKTQQRICFDTLELSKFPWGRGATGQAITPLLTIAVDSTVIPLGTAVYIPEFDGLPRDPTGKGSHDGCFIAQDRGLKVQGKHVDIFTGQRSMTGLWNSLVPSNRGVTIVLDSPHCERAP